MNTEKHKQATVYGFLQLAAFFLVYYIVPANTEQEILHNVSWAIFLISKLGLFFYGQAIVLKLNRDTFTWSVFLLFFTSIALIILGQLDKLEGTIKKITYSPSLDKNVNNLPDILVETDSNLLLDSLSNDSYTLKYMINNYKEYIKEKTNIFPLVAAYELNQTEEILDSNILDSLSTYAKENGYNDFLEMAQNYKQA